MTILFPGCKEMLKIILGEEYLKENLNGNYDNDSVRVFHFPSRIKYFIDGREIERLFDTESIFTGNGYYCSCEKIYYCSKEYNLCNLDGKSVIIKGDGIFVIYRRI